MMTNTFSTFCVQYAESPTCDNFDTLDIRISNLDKTSTVKLNPYYFSLDNALLLTSDKEEEVVKGFKMYEKSVMYGINKLRGMYVV